MATHPRRWFAFRVRTLFVVVAMLSLPAGWVGREWRIVQERRALSGGILVPARRWLTPADARQGIPRLSWFREMLGGQVVPEISLEREMPSDLVERVRAAFPEVRIVRLDVPGYPGSILQHVP